MPSADGAATAGPLPQAAGDGAAAEPQIANVVSRLRRAMRRAARAAGKGGALPGGLSVAQHEMLACLSENPGARPGQLARLLRLAPSSVATLLNGLRRAGLVTRTGSADDRRAAVIELTAAGQDAVSQWQEVNARILAAALTALPADSRSALTDSLPVLRELTDAIDALADEPQGQAAI
ncbi:MAG: MarR family winged helix-turn-helix transcriptional regulator [Streptosporangiaceae bacterium]